ncbi:50S ribosomal protein L23 [Bienertia sinuspersici]
MSWNIRGLNGPNKVITVKRIGKQQNVTIVCILETKVKPTKIVAIQNKLGRRWSWFCNYEYSSRGRIWWAVSDTRRKSSSHLTVVYGLNTIEARTNLRRNLGNHSVATPWVLLEIVILSCLLRTG